MADELAELIVADAGAWRTWLGERHADSPGVWLVLAKKGHTEPTSLTYEQALDQALCHGWIDGQIARRDERTFKQRFTPRRARSAWSERNVAHIERLTEQGLMHPAGVAAVERAKADGRWQEAYAGAASIEIPADLASALSAVPKAQANFELLSSQNRYAILYRLGAAKRADTRARRIEQYVDMLARGETIHPQRRRLAKLRRSDTMAPVPRRLAAIPSRLAASPGALAPGITRPALSPTPSRCPSSLKSSSAISPDGGSRRSPIT